MRLRALTLLAAGVVGMGGCSGGEEGETAEASMSGQEEIVLGPKDGLDLPPTDLERVVAGMVAPDFSALSLGGPVVTLSQYRGEKSVVLFFYRGHW